MSHDLPLTHPSAISAGDATSTCLKCLLFVACLYSIFLRLNLLSVFVETLHNLSAGLRTMQRILTTNYRVGFQVVARVLVRILQIAQF